MQLSPLSQHAPSPIQHLCKDNYIDVALFKRTLCSTPLHFKGQWSIPSLHELLTKYLNLAKCNCPSARADECNKEFFYPVFTYNVHPQSSFEVAGMSYPLIISLNDISQYARLIGHPENDILLPQLFDKTDLSLLPKVLSLRKGGYRWNRFSLQMGHPQVLCLGP